ncbi:MAG: phosphatase PAP2 family protein [Methyloligellaceae bacterium]
MRRRSASERTGLINWLVGLSLADKTAIAVSCVLFGFCVIDPIVLHLVRQLDPAALKTFKLITDLGKSGWILISSAILIAALYILRRGDTGLRFRAGCSHFIGVFGFVFAAVAGSGLVALFFKNLIGRARPKYFNTLGPVEFSPLALSADFAGFPSGHATTAFALATAVACLWPATRIIAFSIVAWVASTRFLIGAHYLTDTVVGAALGVSFSIILRSRLANRRWVFARAPDGALRQRTPLLGAWMWKALKLRAVEHWPVAIKRKFSRRTIDEDGRRLKVGRDV